MKLKLLTALILVCVSSYSYAEVPERIISLKPNITEILFALDAGDRVVGVTTWCNFPPEAKKLPKVADYIHPNVERIIALKPDLVITSEENSVKSPIVALEAAGIPTLVLSFRTIDDFFTSTTELAERIGNGEEGERLIREIKKSLSDVQSRKRPPQKVLMVVGKRPLIAAGPNTFLGELLLPADGLNIIESRKPYPHINMETVLVQNPEVILDLSMGSETNNVQAMTDYWGRYKTLEAVKKGRIYNLDISNFRLGPRLAEQIDLLSRVIHEKTDP